MRALTCILFLSVASASAQDVPTVARADFCNTLIYPPAENPPATQSSSATMFNGHGGAYALPGSNDAPVIPAGGGVRLEESSFGQWLASDLPVPNFPTEYLRNIQQTYLYPPPGTSREQLEQSTGWAFRYKTLLYSNDSQGVLSTGKMRAELFDADEKAKVHDALAALRVALAWSPGDRNLRHTYLDVFYDQLVAESQFILKGEMADLSAYRLGLLALPPNAFIIDKEIEVYTNILAGFRNALGNYGAMLGDFGGVDVTTVDSTATPGTPFGYYVFREEQPYRNQMAAQFLDVDGVVKTVPDLNPQTGEPLDPTTDGRVLFSGFKDFVALMTLLKDYTQSAAELARLYGMRGLKTPTADDAAKGLDLINQVQQEVGLEVQMLVGMFPSDAFPPGDASGARAAISGVQLGLAELAGVRGFLEGRSNPLGFDPNFLVLIQEAPGVGATSKEKPFDSYDSLVRWMSYTPASPLPYADRTFTEACTSYQQFRAYADRVAEDIGKVDEVFNQRFTEITGYASSKEFNGQNPREGSELWVAENTLATLWQQLANAGDISTNLAHQIGTAAEFVNQTANQATAIDNALRRYKNNTTNAWSEIKHAEGSAAQMQAASEMAFAAAGCIASIDGAEWFFGAGAAAACLMVGTANIVVQGDCARQKADSEAELDYESAAYTAALDKIDANLESLQAQQDFDVLLREQISHASDLAGLRSKIAQELAHKTSLLRELDRIRCNAEAGRAAVASRYYADPIHAQRAESQLLRADMAFRRAQRWVFFAQRALEYKWNKEFTYSLSGGRSYDRGSIFKLRNFQELLELVAVMEDFNTVNLLNFNREEFLDRISLRDDILLPFPGTGADTGFRVDPKTGQTIPKNQLFRLILKGERSSPFVERFPGSLVIKLNTVALKKKSGFLFLGPTYNDDGSILTAGKHLDKIQWIKFNLVSSSQTDPVEADLRYGGTCYIRNSVPPCYTGTNAFSLPDANRVFPFEYFYTLDNGITFEVADHQRDTVKLAFSTVSREPEQGVSNSIYENRFLKERSVATTDLRLTIGSSRVDLDRLDDLELYIRHLFVSITAVPDCN
ncbi:MAG TPA: hypothetical protein VEC99_14230 [Clostridia bacterium]|nr:hypothetical protein [Clostridia bacterium]